MSVFIDLNLVKTVNYSIAGTFTLTGIENTLILPNLNIRIGIISIQPFSDLLEVKLSCNSDLQLLKDHGFIPELFYIAKRHRQTNKITYCNLHTLYRNKDLNLGLAINTDKVYEGITIPFNPSI